MKIISQKREYHRKSVKVMRKNDIAEVCNNNWTWVVALGRSPSGWLRCIWQLRSGLGCSSGRVRNITEVPWEGHDELCHHRKAWQHVRDLCKVVKLCMALLRATTPMLSFLRHFCSVFLSPSLQVSVADAYHWRQSLHHLMLLNFSYRIGIHFLSRFCVYFIRIYLFIYFLFCA